VDQSILDFREIPIALKDKATRT